MEKGEGKKHEPPFIQQGILTGNFIWISLHWYWVTNLWGLPISRLHFKEGKQECQLLSSFFILQGFLLLLFFGSRPSDQTEGTFDGIGDSTNMAVINLRAWLNIYEYAIMQVLEQVGSHIGMYANTFDLPFYMGKKVTHISVTSCPV